jgi:hypothetical protein
MTEMPVNKVTLTLCKPASMVMVIVIITGAVNQQQQQQQPELLRGTN